MSHRKALIRLMTLAITTSLVATQASALTFASFGFTGGTRFTLTGNHFTATETGVFTIANGVLPAPYTGYGPFAATFTLTGTLNPGSGSALTLNSNPGTTIINQTVQTLGFKIVGAPASPVAGLDLLYGSLLTTGGGNLSGSVNNNTNTSTGSVGASGTEANIFYGSALLGFQAGARDFSFALNNIAPPVLSINGMTQDIGVGKLTLGDLRDFAADMSANFSATPAPNGLSSVPEPGTWSLFCGLGAAGITFRLRRRRR